MFDLHHDVQNRLALQAAISTNTTTEGAILDTRNAEQIDFTAFLSEFTDGSYELQIFQGEQSDMSDEVQVASVSIKPTSLNDNKLTFTAAVSQGDVLEKLGVMDNNAYMRAKIVSTGVTTGATATVISSLMSRNRPV